MLLLVTLLILLELYLAGQSVVRTLGRALGLVVGGRNGALHLLAHHVLGSYASYHNESYSEQKNANGIIGEAITSLCHWELCHHAWQGKSHKLPTTVPVHSTSFHPQMSYLTKGASKFHRQPVRVRGKGLRMWEQVWILLEEKVRRESLILMMNARRYVATERWLQNFIVKLLPGELYPFVYCTH